VRVPEVDSVLDRKGVCGLELLLPLSEATYGNAISKKYRYNMERSEKSAEKAVL